MFCLKTPTSNIPHCLTLPAHDLFHIKTCQDTLFTSFRYAVDDVDDVNLYYTMANLSVEEILDEHVQAPVDVEKV